MEQKQKRKYVQVNRKKIGLAPRQEAYAQMTADGFTPEEIALEFHVSKRTVEGALEEVKDFVGARNKYHMVAILLRKKLIR